jgi:signal transduction histidine kinase
LQPDTQIVFYRVVQEALNNVAKHARASHVSLALQLVDGAVEMRIRDNGVGFDPEQVPADHFGLKIMAERSQEIQAEFIVQTQINQGTELILRSGA